jgi:hypothetical protein
MAMKSKATDRDIHLFDATGAWSRLARSSQCDVGRWRSRIL